MSKTAVIIGAGIAGIACAIRLKAKGYQVRVIEANPYYGGKLSEISNSGFRFDAGPSLFTMPHYVDELFLLLNENPREHFEYIKLNESCHYFYEDGTQFVAPSDTKEFTELLSDKLSEDKSNVINFMRKSKTLFEITAPVFLYKSLHKISTYLSRKGFYGIANLWQLNMFISMNKHNKKVFNNPKTVQLFNRFATYNGSNPFQAPATLNIIPHLEFGFGTFFPLKGMVDITNSLVALAKRHGVEFILNSKVDEIQVVNNKVLGVKVGNETIKADLVVSNMDVYHTYKKLLPNFEMPNKVKRVESSSSALIFYWGINQQFNELGLHNILFSENYEKEFETLFNKKSIDEDPTIYINITSKYKKDDAISGGENWFVMINVPANHGQNWTELISEARKNIVKKINRILKTDIEPLIIYEENLTPEKIEFKTSSFRGALYGSSSNKMMAAFFRHANFQTKIKDLYFCGGSVHPGGGIPLCLLSAKIVSELCD